MSVMVVKIKNKENTSVLKKIVAALNEKANMFFRAVRSSDLTL
jgi:hypothetical protein